MTVSVLVVEDHPELRRNVEQLLARAGYVVSCAATADEAMEMLRGMERPCLVLWDPVTLHMDAALLAEIARDGIHVATMPVSVRAAVKRQKGAPAFTKTLTSLEAIMNVLREHCPEPAPVMMSS